ncbi:sarcosine oxidase subunit gamma [Coralliovum pocilloporae]|uniref:sarcosine oxidase subunit gamma n=1 Tax=Coralliovum pocilloporae TaxID=3066369 RepID=UPI00330706A6
MANSAALSAASPRSPLAHLTTLMENGSSAKVSLREEAFLVQLNVRGNADDPAFVSAFQGTTGLDLPVEPNTTSRSGRRIAVWLGPDEWGIVAPEEDAALMGALISAFGDQHVSVVDLSDNRTTLSLSGEAAWTVMNKGCPLDIDPVCWSVGKSAQTVYSRAQVLIIQTGDEPEFKLFVRNSFAEYLARFLLENMREFA